MATNPLLLWGTANPEGLAPDYNGVYLTTTDIRDMLEQIKAAHARGEKIPVHLEHSGAAIGNLVSAWEHQNTMQCVLELDPTSMQGAIGSEFVKAGITPELSLGYSVDVSCSKDPGKFSMHKKLLKEVSLVKKGARPSCFVHACTK